MATSPFTQFPTTLPSASGSILANNSISTQLSSILLHNTNTTSETIQLFLVSNNAGTLGAPSAANRITYLTLAVNETLEITFKFPPTLVGTNDALFGQTTTAGKVTFTASGVKTS